MHFFLKKKKTNKFEFFYILFLCSYNIKDFKNFINTLYNVFITKWGFGCSMA